VLNLPEGTILTPLARDVATELGLRIEIGPAPAPGVVAAQHLQGPVTTDDPVADKVREVVLRMLADGAPVGQSQPVSAVRPASRVKLAKQDDAVLEPFPYPGPKPDQQVKSVDVVTAADGPLAAGYLTLTKGEFPWTLSYDEVQIVLEGELHIGTSDGVRVGKPGDILYVPKGSQITFGTPSWAKFVYVTFPADWEAGLK
jgi:ethanolamine utilization protein EutQ